MDLRYFSQNKPNRTTEKREKIKFHDSNFGIMDSKTIGN